MRLRSLLVLTAAAAATLGLAACGEDPGRDETPGDTLAVPAAAIDTTTRTVTDSTGAAVTAGAPGTGTATSGAAAAGVDTPITRRLQAKEAARDSAAPDSVRPR